MPLVSRKIRKVLTPDECDNLVKKCVSERERLIIVGLLDTGLRRKEFLSLKPDFFDFKRKFLNYYTKKRGKKKDCRSVPLSPRASTVFKFWFKKHKKLGFSARTINRVLKNIGVRVGIRNITPTALRHTYAINCLKSGKVKPRELQKRLGHKDVYCTIVYLMRIDID